MPPNTADQQLATAIVALARTRWPTARFTRRGTTVRWTDGPALPDLRPALTDAGITPERLDQHTIQLQRCFSPHVMATIALATRTQPLRATLAAAQELGAFAIPNAGLPPLRIHGDHLERCWRRAQHLCAFDLPRDRVPTDRTRKLEAALNRARQLANSLTDHLLDTGPNPAWLAARDRHRRPVNIGDAIPALSLPVLLPDHPDHRIVATIPLGPDTPRGHEGGVPAAELHWTDGPSPGQVLDAIERTRHTLPIGRCRTITTNRAMSPTAVAASVILYQRLHGRPYHDPTAHLHFMQRWKVASVRELERRTAPARRRLEQLQEQLLAVALPPPGPIAVGTGKDTTAIDGPALWDAAETLGALVLQTGPLATVAYTPGSESTRRLASAQANQFHEAGEAAFNLLRQARV